MIINSLLSKKIICAVSLAGLFGFAYLAFGQDSGSSIPKTGPDSFFALLDGFAKAIAGVVGSVGTVMLIVSGILYVTSAGSTEQMGKAKKTLLYAIVGMALGLSASAIVEFAAKTVGS